MSGPAPRVVVAGSINMDIVARVERHPTPGETLMATDVAYLPGGKGANQAVAAARAGSRVTMLGCVGDDAFGATMLDFLSSEQIQVGDVAVRAATPTGTALIFVDAHGENEIVVVAGANATLDAGLVAGAAPAAGDVLLAQFETPLAATQALFEQGHAAGATCVLNPAPAHAIDHDLLHLIDVLVVNETELAAVAGSARAAAPSAADVQAAADALRDGGFPGGVVATLGARGSIAVIAGRVIATAGRRVDAVDTTGAGDCFVGYLASALAGGQGVEHALRAANVAGSICVQRAGAGRSMPAIGEVRDVMAREA